MSWFTRLFGSKSEQAEFQPVNDDKDMVNELGGYADRLVAAGFMTREEIIETALDYVEDSDRSITLRREAERVTDEALKAHSEKQATWPDATDCDRLDAAFAALEADGVISRQDFTCCGTCGAAEIWHEIEDAQGATGRSAKGYAFYHQQDTESAVEGYGLYLNYGACEEGEEAAVAVGHEIVATLNKHGLSTEWDGKLSQRIAVSLDWKKRRGDQSGVPI